MPDTSPETLELLAEITTRNLFASGHTKNEPAITLNCESACKIDPLGWVMSE